MFCLSIKSHSYYSDVDQVQQENFDQVQHLQKDVDQVQHLVFDQVQHLVFDQVQPALQQLVNFKGLFQNNVTKKILRM